MYIQFIALHEVALRKVHKGGLSSHKHCIHRFFPKYEIIEV